MSRASDVVKLAQSQLGYHEKASNSDLDSLTGNAGSGNWTKYARDLYKAGYYNGNKNGFAWCDVFVDWLFYTLFGALEGQRIQCQTGELGAACPYSAGYYKAQGRYDRDPRVGDQVFFQQNGNIVHTGIVESVTPTTVTTIEGNSGNRVARHMYSRSDPYIDGYGHPRYDEADDPGDSAGGSAGTTSGTAITVSATQVRSGSRGSPVKKLQILLNGLGYGCGAADGIFGTRTLGAVRAYQTAVGIAVDGIVGKNTWGKLIG